MSLHGKHVLLTGASMGIGASIARSLAQEKATITLIARSKDKLANLVSDLGKQYPGTRLTYHALDIGNYEAVDAAIKDTSESFGAIDFLINNAGLALGAPNIFPELKISEIQTMLSTNVNGLMYATYSVLNHGMMKTGAGTILNITSVTGLEAPPFPGEAVYHSNKAAQEAFTNSLRNELVGTNIKVLAIRPGVVATNFHSQRVGHDKALYDSFIGGYEPLVAEDIAEAVLYMLKQPDRVSIKALDVVPSAQRSLTVFDREWNKRN